MDKPIFERFARIPCHLINHEDRLFAISLPWTPLDSLTDSIRASGILSPLHLQMQENGNYRIVIGWRRFQVARALGLPEVPSLLRKESDDLALFLQALEDNLVTRSLHLLEKARVLFKLKECFQVSTRDLIDDFLPRLKLPPQRFQLQRCFELARLPETLQRSIFDILEPEIALKLSSWHTEEQAFFLSRVSRFRLGKNKQRQFFNLLDELRSSQQVLAAHGEIEASILHTVWSEVGGERIEQDESLPLSERWEQLMQTLRRLRFPHLSKHEKELARLRSSLKLPPQIRLRVPAYFEGDKIQISFWIRCPEELTELSRKLEEIAESQELNQILQLL